jgi:hypothetical protein
MDGAMVTEGARGWRVTARDIEWLRWLGRWRSATVAQLAREFRRRGESAPEEAVSRRMRAWRALGLVTSQRLLADEPGVHSLTGQGMRLVELMGAVAGPKLAELRHDLAVIDLAHRLLTDRPSHELHTEREIRRAESPGFGAEPECRLSVAKMDAGMSQFKRVYPDLATVTPSGLVVAHELEASRKEHRRLVKLMLSFIHARSVASVRYYVLPHLAAGSARAAGDANQAARELGRGEFVKVFQWPAPESGDFIQVPARRGEA